jgi:hypothetical protein
MMEALVGLRSADLWWLDDDEVNDDDDNDDHAVDAGRMLRVSVLRVVSENEQKHREPG